MKLKTHFSLAILMSFSFFLHAQKNIHAYRSNASVTLDGVLDEEAWSEANTTSDFITLRPKPGLVADHQTEVRLIYDDEAIYVGAYMKDVSRDSIMTQLTERDDIGNTDFFGFMIDTYGNQSEGYEFITASTGVQFDALVSPNNEDNSWDAVWFSAVSLTDAGWYAEVKIPYSAIRFQKKDEQDWRINFFRRRAVTAEQSFWAELDPENDNAFLQSCGNVVGLGDIEPPIRLSFSPYASIYGLNSKDNSREVVNTTGYSYNMGMDVKYGINDAFTLDMTLIPDFGQVQQDDEVLNLTAFEIRFSENRPFFTEGVDLFEKANIFYSRRVGANQQLYNATKISGRNGNGVGLGFFNAVGAEETALVENDNGVEEEVIVTPLTNYNIVVADKQLKNSSNIGFINTNVTRRGDEFYNANVSAIDFDIKDKDQKYGVNGKLVLSQLIFKNDDNISGHNIEVEVGKLSGNFTYGIGYNEESPNYDPNDLGFLRSPNERAVYLYGGYQKFDGLWKFQQFQSWFNASYTRIIDPNEFTGLYFNTGWWAQSASQWNFNMWANTRPASYDYFEPRVQGVPFKRPAHSNIGYWFGSDNRKKLRVQNSLWIYKNSDRDWKGFEVSVSPRYRFADNFSVYTSISYSEDRNQQGFVSLITDDEIIFGRRDRITFNNVLGANYSFNDKMTLDLRVRHYWTSLHYKEYFQLDSENGSLLPSDYTDFNDQTFNAFTTNMTYRWRFAPGSDLFLVWKSDIIGVHEDEVTDFSTLKYRDGINRLQNLPQDHSISLRLVYYIDYLNIAKAI